MLSFNVTSSTRMDNDTVLHFMSVWFISVPMSPDTKNFEIPHSTDSNSRQYSMLYILTLQVGADLARIFQATPLL